MEWAQAETPAVRETYDVCLGCSELVSEQDLGGPGAVVGGDGVLARREQRPQGALVGQHAPPADGRIWNE